MHSTRDSHENLAERASQGVRAGQRAGQHAFDRLSEHAADWRDEAAPAVDRLTERAGDMARQGADWVRDSGERVRSQVVRASDRTVSYVRDEPVRSLMMAAAAGALIFALVRLMSGRSKR